MTSRPNSKLLKTRLSRFENKHCEDSVTNKDKVNVNYKYDDLKNEIHWQIATSRNNHGHSANTGKMLLKETKNLIKFTSILAIGFLLYITMIKTLQRKGQQVQFLIYLRKFQLIVETHLPMKMILCEIKDRLYVPPRIL